MVWAPFKHILSATGESVGKLGKGAGKVVKGSINAVRGVGNSFSKHANMAVRNMSRKGKKSKKRSTRKSRR
jgi:hypothetical protein